MAFRTAQPTLELPRGITYSEPSTMAWIRAYARVHPVIDVDSGLHNAIRLENPFP